MLKKKIQQALATHPPQNLHMPYPEAAVMVLLTDEVHPHIILTQRAQGMKTHGGQVAFPGGMRDPEDEDLLATALRETREEVGIEPQDIELCGRLSQVVSKHKILVTPYVGVVPADVRTVMEVGELDAIFRVPIHFFLETPPTRIDRVTFMGWKVNMPAWNYGRFHIWGMSALILSDFLNKVEGYRVPNQQETS
ncbi:MAG: CoA pyrophosphatase [Gammaproteobacteria bacterium]|nr:MAG: CoA pyrophosphatase [Gammaproteobacteria bacterium]